MQNNSSTGLFQSANEAAAAQQKWHFCCLGGSLILLALGAVFSLAPNTSKCTAIVAAVLFGGTIGLTLLMAFKRFDKTWYNARAVAESVKTRTWRFIMRAEPYDCGDPAARGLFAEDLAAILKENVEAAKIIPATEADAITVDMENVRNLDLPARKEFYKTNRVDEQLAWYVLKATFNRQCRTVWFCVMIFFQLCALVWVILKLEFPERTLIPTGLFTTLAGAALGWMQAKRFGELSTSFNLTAHEIAIISSHYRLLSDEQKFSAFVRDSEAAFSREHTQWVARRGI